MKDAECSAFLQWALPRVHMRWPGFRKVRKTVCKRVDARLKELGLSGMAAYRSHLESTPAEWPVLDRLCTITISRFYRDRAVCDFLGGTLLPELARSALTGGERQLRAWSIGCASGEEAYTLMLLWKLRVLALVPDMAFRVVATDVDEAALTRARAGCYGWSSLKELPPEWRERAFERVGESYRVRPEYRDGIAFLLQDIRAALPDASFHLVLCRNLVLTYFDERLQRQTLARILSRLVPGGALVIGKGEVLPATTSGLTAWSETLGVYRTNGCVDSPPRAC